MKSINFNQEWDFVISEVHRNRPDMKNLGKRELLLVLQILLCRIGLASDVKELNILKRGYSGLKDMYMN